jgi:serine/threonine-protein kinase
MIILLSVASAIAIFGSWKISALHQEAMQARRLGQYQLKELIGSGGMGEVYLGEHMMLRRACAIKLIRADQNGDGTNLSRFEREVRAMATLTHWNTVEVYDYGLADDGTFYYVMEYLPGMSLQELVDRHGPLSPARTIYFLRQVCDALQEAHSIGLIHRDVKPSNVLATERGGIYDVAKLLDFGLVQSFGVSNQDARLTIQGVVLGSPPYMSPEQAMGKELDHRTDIYSVGGLGYFLLTGQPAFERESPMQVLMAHVYEKVAPLAEVRPDVPADLEAVIMKCLSKEPRDRYPDAESLERALAECDAASGWDRKDAAQWWRQNHTKQKSLQAAVA